jgi:hypothetical protein
MDRRRLLQGLGALLLATAVPEAAGEAGSEVPTWRGFFEHGFVAPGRASVWRKRRNHVSLMAFTGERGRDLEWWAQELHRLQGLAFDFEGSGPVRVVWTCRPGDYAAAQYLASRGLEVEVLPRAPKP